MLVSVIIPTNRPRGVLEPCLQALARQDLPAESFEVIVCFNGVPAEHWNRGDWPFRLVVLHHPEAHIGMAKNLALDHARGETIVLLNDDVRPRADFLRRHLAAHAHRDQPCQVLGLAQWQRPAGETLFDRMICTTSMIFFYDQLRPHCFYNYRHAWNLNLSISRRLLQSERFNERLGPFFFEDLELAFRLERNHGARVWFAPEAHALHVHQYTLAGYLEREEALGRAALRLWQANPECFQDVYRARPDELRAPYEHYVQLESRGHASRLERFARVSGCPTEAYDDNPVQMVDLINVLYDTHLPLKRLAFRRGFLDALGQPEPAADTTLQPVEL